MNKINKIKSLLGMEVKLEQMTLDNGTIVEAEMFEPNNEIFVVTEEERIPLPVGEYALEDGRILVITEEGLIAEIKDAAPAEEPMEEAAEEPELEEEPTTPKKIVESISKELFFSEIEKLRSEFKTELEALKPKEVKEKVEMEEVKPIKPSPEKPVEKRNVLFSQKRTQNTRDRVWNKISNIKRKK